ncbi:MAG: ISAzo13 family transposase, partial [Actinobacteria bacterium]|nr:ISAzo13 family transposase [Actinomycetota bacterium]
ISIDCKKKELVGDFKNAGREWRPKGEPELVRVHDFKDKQLGKAIPYGVYDIAANRGWVNVGIDHDTAQFAVNSIGGWWQHLGQASYPDATRLQITADCGGSNGNRLRLWKVELQTLAQETGLEIAVCHLPPGTSKWNRIEHRLFSYITMNWRGKPLVSLETMINLIGATKTSTGLEVYARLDDGEYPAKIRVSDAELEAVNLQREEFHPEWNYSIKPRTKL